MQVGGSCEGENGHLSRSVGEDRDPQDTSIHGHARGFPLKHSNGTALGGKVALKEQRNRRAEAARFHANGKGSSFELTTGVISGHQDGKYRPLYSSAARR